MRMIKSVTKEDKLFKGLCVSKTIATIPILLCVLISCADEEAANRIKAREQFSNALALIAKADRGYVPEGQEIETLSQVGDKTVNEKKADPQAYRQRVLAEAAKELEALLDIGSLVQQVAVRRMLADIYVSQVRHVQRQVMMQWADHSNHSATLLSYLGAVDRAESSIRLLDTDETLLLETLNAQRNTIQEQTDQLKDQAQELRKEEAKLTSQIEKLNTKSNLAADKAQSLQTKALLATQGPKQYDLYDESAVTDREANVASANAQQLAVRLDIVKTEAAFLEKQARLTQQAIRTVNEQIELAQNRQTNAPQKEAIASKNKAAQELVDQFGSFVDDYTSKIQTHLNDAAQKMQVAIELLTLPPNLSTTDTKSVEVDLLAHLVSMTHVLTDHIITAAGHGNILASISQQVQHLIPEHSTLFTENAQQIQTIQQGLIESAKQVISQANTLYGDISQSLSEGDSLTDFVQQQAIRLETYQRRIDQLRLSPPRK